MSGLSRLLTFSLAMLALTACFSWAEGDGPLQDHAALGETFDAEGQNTSNQPPVVGPAGSRVTDEDNQAPQGAERNRVAPAQNPSPKQPVPSTIAKFADGGAFIGLVAGFIGGIIVGVWGVGLPAASIAMGVLAGGAVLLGGVLIGAGIGALIGLIAKAVEVVPQPTTNPS